MSAKVASPMAVHDTQFDIDTVCSLLKSEHRRLILRTLDGEEVMTLEELTWRLVDKMGERGGADAVKVRLYHEHLPKLTECGAVKYSTDTEMVSLTVPGKQLVSCLDTLEECTKGNR